MTSNVNLFYGDCQDFLKTLPSNSLDSCVTDPPYGISFMGNQWDYDVPTTEIWKEVLRVLKPGAYLVAFFSARTYHRGAIKIEDAGFNLRDQIMWLYGSGFPKNPNTQLKPAHEPIVIAQKPCLGTIKANVSQYGVGYLNVDDCRISVSPNDPELDTNRANPRMGSTIGGNGKYGGGGIMTTSLNPNGRWPANVIHDGSEEMMMEFADYGERKSGAKKQGSPYNHSNCRTMGASAGSVTRDYPADIGSVARFFYCAKASPSERGKYNTHPTVKPLTLMRYLCKLVTPKGGTVLDPFTGSGTTGVSCVLEGFGFVGAEREKSSVDIAQRRIAEAQQ